MLILLYRDINDEWWVLRWKINDRVFKKSWLTPSFQPAEELTGVEREKHAHVRTNLRLLPPLYEVITRRQSFPFSCPSVNSVAISFSDDPLRRVLLVALRRTRSTSWLPSQKLNVLTFEWKITWNVFFFKTNQQALSAQRSGMQTIQSDAANLVQRDQIGGRFSPPFCAQSCRHLR